MKLILVPRRRGVRTLLRRVPVDGGHTYQQDGREEFFYEVTIDADRLQALANAAAKNKSSRAVKGPFTIRVIERARMAEEGV